MESGFRNALANRPNWVAWVVSAFCAYHALAILHTLVPDWGLLFRFASTAAASSGEPLTESKKVELSELNRKAMVLPPERPMDGMFLNYRILSGTRQDWQMFHLAPRDHDLEIVLEARDVDGRSHLLGPNLPGFEEVDVLEDGRFYHLWGRYENWNEQSYINTYLEKVGSLLKQSQDPVYKDFKLIYRKHILLTPEEVAATGMMSTVKTREWWHPLEE